MDTQLNRQSFPFAMLKEKDHKQNAFVFLTLCTKDLEASFGKIKYPVPWIENGEKAFSDMDYLEKTEAGNIALHFWEKLPSQYSFLKLDLYSMMPNHIQGILIFDKSIETTFDPLPDPFPKRQNMVTQADDLSFANFRSTALSDERSKLLSSILRKYKTSVKTEAIRKDPDFSWQPRFHERVLKDEEEYETIRNYILTAPANWYPGADPLLMHRSESGILSGK